jgi:AcrR family transcriptional regulator
MKESSTSERIKANAKELFFAYGLRSISMDDLAKMSGVSKKTIYQYYEDKDVLVHAVVMDLVQLHERLLSTYQTLAEDAIDEAITMDTRLFGIWTDVRPAFFYEVKKFFPDAWLELEYYSLKMRNCIIGNLERGKKEGLYRNDINVALIAELSMHQHISLLRSQFATTQKLSTEELAKEITNLQLHSITTEKGKTLLNNYIIKEN